MKLRNTSLITIALLLITFCLSAQEAYRGTVTVFSEEGENFTLYLNGDQKNSNAATRVVAENITEVPVSFRIVFENKAIPELKKKGLRAGKTCIYAIQKNRKGEHVLKIKDCTELFNADGSAPAEGNTSTSSTTTTTSTTASSNQVRSTPSQLSASYADGIITINDGRTLTVAKVKANGMTYPRLMMSSPQGAKAAILYDDNTEQYAAEVPFKYEVKDFSNNNSYFTLTVDEGGPAKTWHVKLQNSNGYDLKID